jgi:hypothetical protein
LKRATLPAVRWKMLTPSLSLTRTASNSTTPSTPQVDRSALATRWLAAPQPARRGGSIWSSSRSLASCSAPRSSSPRRSGSPATSGSLCLLPRAPSRRPGRSSIDCTLTCGRSTTRPLNCHFRRPKRLRCQSTTRRLRIVPGVGAEPDAAALGFRSNAQAPRRLDQKSGQVFRDRGSGARDRNVRLPGRKTPRCPECRARRRFPCQPPS